MATVDSGFVMLSRVVGEMRIGLISFGVAEFAVLRETCVDAGHDPVVYAYSRSMRPNRATDEGAAEVVGRITAALPAGVDLLLPGSSEGLGAALRGYDLDLLVCYGFSWRLPSSVLRLPRFGVVDVHCSMLPKCRGPAPVPWAIRNGDPYLGMTVHRMNEEFDTGPILVQEDGVTIPDDVTPRACGRGWLRCCVACLPSLWTGSPIRKRANRKPPRERATRG